MEATHSLRRYHSANTKLEHNTGFLFRYIFYIILATLILLLALKYSAVYLFQRAEMEALGRENMKKNQQIIQNIFN